MPRVVLFGAVWIAMLAAVLAALWRPRPARVGIVTSEIRVSAPEPPARPPRAGTHFPGWTVTRAYSAHHMMVVEVETELTDTARQIAAQVVEPVKNRYDEILVYVRKPGTDADKLPARRVQWTKRGGYAETTFDSPP